MSRALGVAHLTLIELSPPELVTVAAAAGFDFIGVRVKAVTPQERAFPMGIGSPMLAETIARLDDTGMYVKDIEFLPLTAATERKDWIGMLESGHALGASAITVAGADPDRGRLLDTLCRLTEDARAYGIRPLLEPISYQPVSRVADAAELARRAGAGIMIDALHLCRADQSFAEVSELQADLIPVVQLCDGARTAPAPVGDPASVPLLQHEAREQRRLVGEGEMPLADLLRALPRDLPISIEVPHAELQERLSPTDYAMLNAQSARELIGRVDG